MSDKSKLGFNINPKNYDELNSTDNLITSGSDSGWLGKKLQGDDSNDLNLSKINPLFDKELYEKYRPGVNTNDGSVNQDIWGYKCFNSPVSFRNGIYGDTYSITEQKSSGETIDLVPETYATIKSDTTVKNKIYNRTENDANNYSEYTYKKYHGPIDYDNSQFTYMDTVIPDSDEHTISDIIIKNHSESHCDNNAFAINDEYERTLCSVRPNYYTASASDGADAQYVYSVNYTSAQYERKLQAYTPKIDYKIISESGDEYIADEIKEENATTILRMSAESPYRNEKGDIHKLGSSILLETSSEQHDSTTYINQLASIEICSPQHGYYTTESYVDISAKKDGSIGSINITPGYMRLISEANSSAPYISIDGSDNSITLFAGKLNLPGTIETTAKFANRASALSKEINSANYIYATDNSILPSSNNIISLGNTNYRYNHIYANRLVGVAQAAQGITYRNIVDGTYTVLLITTENQIIPYENKKIDIGSTIAPLQHIYADKFIGTAAKAEKAVSDEYGNNIATTYFNNSLNNTITGATTISRTGNLLQILPNSLDEKEHCSISIDISDVYMRYKTTLNLHQQDNTNLACSLSLYEYHNNDVSSFSILPSVESTTSGIVRENVAFNIGGENNYFTNIYCRNFPTIHKTIAGTTDTTSVGNIRLLCIKGPTTLTTIEHEIQHGSIIKNPMQIGGKQFTIHIANLRIYENSKNLIGVTGEVDTVEGEWQLLSSALVVANSPSIAIFTPVLAMRVK